MADHCDVLVVGGGGAALRAALAAHEAHPELDVALITKGDLGRSGVTATACSDRMAFHATLSTTEPGGPDAWRHHADDIYRIGGNVSDADLAEVLASHAAQAFAYLDDLNVPWARQEDGSPDQFVTDGSKYARACYTGPYTANHIEAALVAHVKQTPIRIIERAMVAELLQDAAGAVVGAAIVDQDTGDVSAIAAKAVILATGGAGQAFRVNVFPPDCTGDGYALAFRAGAELVNLEFIQIGLCSLKTKLACSGSMMRALPRLVNDLDDEFLPRYLAEIPAGQRYDVLFSKGASWPISYREPSHIIDIAVAAEIAAGRKVYLDYASDPVGLDLTELSDDVRAWYTETKGIDLEETTAVDSPLKRLRAINQPSIDWLAERGVDLEAGDMVEIAPAIQHFQGGVKIRTHGETTVPGLYAAGETAGGQHGANRPGGNALLDSQVFGIVSGQSAARYAKRSPVISVDDATAQAVVSALFDTDGAPSDQVFTLVKDAMAKGCGVLRTESGLNEAIAKLIKLATEGVSNHGNLAEAVEAVNALCVGQLVAGATLRRDESRGPHLRFGEDGSLTPAPRDDARWERYIVVRANDGAIAYDTREPVRP